MPEKKIKNNIYNIPLFFIPSIIYLIVATIAIIGAYKCTGWFCDFWAILMNIHWEWIMEATKNFGGILNFINLDWFSCGSYGPDGTYICPSFFSIVWYYFFIFFTIGLWYLFVKLNWKNKIIAAIITIVVVFLATSLW